MNWQEREKPGPLFFSFFPASGLLAGSSAGLRGRSVVAFGYGKWGEFPGKVDGGEKEPGNFSFVKMRQTVDAEPRSPPVGFFDGDKGGAGGACLRGHHMRPLVVGKGFLVKGMGFEAFPFVFEGVFKLSQGIAAEKFQSELVGEGEVGV